MRYSSQVKPISYLKANAVEVLKRLGEQRKPLVITQHGEAKALLQDVRSYEQPQEPWHYSDGRRDMQSLLSDACSADGLYPVRGRTLMRDA